MVLIGGKNGAGKTTLFNAIKICLYGCVAYGFESNNAKYFAEIEKIINANEKLQKIGEAEVVIDLLMDDGKYDHTYTFVRSWRVAGKKIAEMKIINKLFDSGEIRRVVITMYGNDLLDQWAIQIRENYKNKQIKEDIVFHSF